MHRLDAVASHGLGLVEGVVGALEQHAGFALFRRVRGRQADAHRQPALDAILVQDVAGHQGLADALGHTRGAGGVGFGQQHRELLAAGTHHQVTRALETLFQHLGHLLEAIVAAQVPVTLVVEAEKVDVDHEQRQVGAVAPAAPPFLVQALVEATLVEQAGQPVLVRQFFEQLVGGGGPAVQHGDVVEQGQQHRQGGDDTAALGRVPAQGEALRTAAVGEPDIDAGRHHADAQPQLFGGGLLQAPDPQQRTGVDADHQQRHEAAAAGQEGLPLGHHRGQVGDTGGRQPGQHRRNGQRTHDFAGTLHPAVGAPLHRQCITQHRQAETRMPEGPQPGRAAGVAQQRPGHHGVREHRHQGHDDDRHEEIGRAQPDRGRIALAQAPAEQQRRQQAVGQQHGHAKSRHVARHRCHGHAGQRRQHHRGDDQGHHRADGELALLLTDGQGTRQGRGQDGRLGHGGSGKRTALFRDNTTLIHGAKGGVCCPVVMPRQRHP